MNTSRGRELLALLPPLSRGRGFRLYAQGGRRFVDLWQYGGAAILGHNPPGVLRELKNTAERGLLAPLPHLRENRLVKALSRLFPGAAIRLYADEASLRRALLGAGIPGAEDPFPDPALAGSAPGDAGKKALSLWRPFLPEEPAAPWLIPVLPWPLAPPALAVRAGGPLPKGELISQGDTLSPVILAAVARAVHDLAAAGERGEPKFPVLRRALEKSPWRRRGIYLSPPENAAYGELFRRFLEAGFLLPPEPSSPLILPGILSPGEEAGLAALLAEASPRG